MTKLTTKNWVKIRVNTVTKTYTMTTQFFNTQSEGNSTIKNNQYKMVNKKSLDKMIADGWTEKIVKAVSKVVDLTGNPEVERQIEEYAKQKAERDIEKYGKKKANQEKIKNFLTEVPQEKVEKFDLSKQHEKFEKTGRPRSLKALAEQRADYCGM